MSSTGARGRKTIETRVIDGLIKDEEEFIQSLKVFGNNNSVGSIAGESSGGSLPTSNESSNGKISDLGNISGNFVIDFAIMDDKNLVANVLGDVNITFTNIPLLLTLQLRLYIRSTDPIITIDGTIVSGVGSSPLITTAIGDFLDISLESTDQINVTVLSVKKNDESAGIPGLPSFVGNIETSLHTETSFTVAWDPPQTGDTPITYDLEYSLSPAETAGVPDTPIIDPTTKDLTTESVSITGLIAGTTYYIWVKAKNALGDSGFNGPVQTNTDGTTNAGDVIFSVVPKTGTFNTITAQWTQPTGKQLKFSLLREIEPGIFTTLIRDNIPAPSATFTFDDKFLDPDVAYNYRLEIRNEFGAIIPATPVVLDPTVATTNALPAPTVVFVNDGARLKFTVTLPVGIRVATVQWSLNNAVDVNGAFTDASTKIIDITDDIGRDPALPFDVIFFTPVLTISTLYYGHAKLRKNAGGGPYSATANATTGNVLPPPQPNITVTSPAVGQIRLKLTFNGSQNTAEKIAVSYRLSSSVGEYTELETFERDAPQPADDLNALENKIEVIRSGFTSGQQLTFRAASSNTGGASTAGPDFDTVLID